MENRTGNKWEISVIVPVYKVEQYLPQCIDSILSQTFTDFELILVDDGSPDNCGAICDEYARKDSRIEVIHQENRGVSAARNTALDWIFEHSDSRWITFVDSDDCIAPNFLGELLRHGTERSADIVVTGAHTFVNDSELEAAPCNIVRTYDQPGRECCKDIFLRQDFFMTYPWGKLYRRELFSDIRYPDGKVYEDLSLIPQILYKAPKVTILRSWLYRYRQRADSIVHRAFDMRRYDQIEAIDTNIHFLREQGEDEIAKLAQQYRNTHIAEYTLLAAGANLLHKVPDQYKMPLWKAFYMTMSNTLRRGKITFVFERIGKYFARLSRK